MRGQMGSTEIEKKKEEKGSFVQLVHEILAWLVKPDVPLTTKEYQLILYFIQEVIGFHALFRPIKVETIIKGTGLTKQKIHPTIESLIEKKVIIKKKIKGLRCSVFGFNDKKFGRVLVGEPRMTQYRIESKVVDLRTFKVLKVRTSKVLETDTFKNQKTATGADLGKAKYQSSKSITLNISQRELLEFLSNQPRQTKSRWEKVIAKVLDKFPEDEPLLWFAIDYVHRTGMDFFGSQISRSTIGLFEKCDWILMKSSVKAVIDQIKAEKEKEQKREENQRLVEETRRTLQAKQDKNDNPTQEHAMEEIGKILKMIR
jgi:hypothetical protein